MLYRLLRPGGSLTVDFCPLDVICRSENLCCICLERRDCGSDGSLILPHMSAVTVVLGFIYHTPKTYKVIDIHTTSSIA